MLPPQLEIDPMFGFDPANFGVKETLNKLISHLAEQEKKQGEENGRVRMALSILANSVGAGKEANQILNPNKK